jgi:ribose 5-phosphate isomerase B
MRIVIGTHHLRGVEALEHVQGLLTRLGHEVQVGARRDAKGRDYPEIAYAVGSAVAKGTADRGILLGGTGIGMCIAANKIPGIRAALVHDEVGAEISRRHNDANVLCIPTDMLGARIIERIVETWLVTDFEGGRHARRVGKIAAIEQGIDPAPPAATERRSR